MSDNRSPHVGDGGDINDGGGDINDGGGDININIKHSSEPVIHATLHKIEQLCRKSVLYKCKMHKTQNLIVLLQNKEQFTTTKRADS